MLALIKFSGQLAVPVVPQGGRTGLSGEAVPSAGCIVLSLEEMTYIEKIYSTAGTLLVEMGVTLLQAQTAAHATDMFFWLGIGSRGSCTIGDALATNAGGNHVSKYGRAR